MNQFEEAINEFCAGVSVVLKHDALQIKLARLLLERENEKLATQIKELETNNV